MLVWNSSATRQLVPPRATPPTFLERLMSLGEQLVPIGDRLVSTLAGTH
jgi:hypothetical protein